MLPWVPTCRLRRRWCHTIGDRDADRLGSEDAFPRLLKSLGLVMPVLLLLGVGHQEARCAGKIRQGVYSPRSGRFDELYRRRRGGGGSDRHDSEFDHGWLLAFTVKLLISYVKFVAPAGTLGLFGSGVSASQVDRIRWATGVWTDVAEVSRWRPDADMARACRPVDTVVARNRSKTAGFILPVVALRVAAQSAGVSANGTFDSW